MARFEKCRFCAVDVPTDATFCIRCGASLLVPVRQRPAILRCLLWLSVAVLLLTWTPYALGRDFPLDGHVVQRAHQGADQAKEGARELVRRVYAFEARLRNG